MSDYKFELYLGLPDESDTNFIYSPRDYFSKVVNKSWLRESLSREIIKDIDRAKVDRNYLIHPVYGKTSFDRLSSEVKTLILCLHDRSGHYFNLSGCGDGCFKWLGKISKRTKFKAALFHYAGGWDKSAFPIKIVNDGRIVKNEVELFIAMKECGV